MLHALQNVHSENESDRQKRDTESGSSHSVPLGHVTWLPPAPGRLAPSHSVPLSFSLLGGNREDPPRAGLPPAVPRALGLTKGPPPRTRTVGRHFWKSWVGGRVRKKNWLRAKGRSRQKGSGPWGLRLAWSHTLLPVSCTREGPAARPAPALPSPRGQRLTWVSPPQALPGSRIKVLAGARPEPDPETETGSCAQSHKAGPRDRSPSLRFLGPRSPLGGCHPSGSQVPVGPEGASESAVLGPASQGRNESFPEQHGRPAGWRSCRAVLGGQRSRA